jgi:hypothetical protein
MKILSIFFLLLSAIAYGQSSFGFIKNSTISFKYRFTGGGIKSKEGYILSRYLIHVELNDLQRKAVKKINKNEWLKILEDSTCDWAANLILYDLNKKDAIVFWANKVSEKTWHDVFRKRDIIYWKRRLR